MKYKLTIGNKYLYRRSRKDFFMVRIRLQGGYKQTIHIGLRMLRCGNGNPGENIFSCTYFTQATLVILSHTSVVTYVTNQVEITQQLQRVLSKSNALRGTLKSSKSVIGMLYLYLVGEHA